MIRARLDALLQSRARRFLKRNAVLPGQIVNFLQAFFVDAIGDQDSFNFPRIRPQRFQNRQHAENDVSASLFVAGDKPVFGLQLSVFGLRLPAADFEL
jgi:hypothetical protein